MQIQQFIQREPDLLRQNDCAGYYNGQYNSAFEEAHPSLETTHHSVLSLQYSHLSEILG